MSTGDNIRRLRKEKNFTQKKLGELCGMYESQIRKYELGKANPKLESIRKIASALGVYMNELISDWSQYSPYEISKDWEYSKDELSKTNENLEKLDGLFSQLNNHGQDKAIEQIELLTKIPEYKAAITKSDKCTTQISNKGILKEMAMLNAAHKRTDIEVTDEMRQHDDDIMDDDSEWE